MTKSKIDELKDRIQKDLEKIKLLEQKRNDELAKLISKLDLKDLEDDVLVGALLYVKKQVATKSPLTEEWLDAGQKFLKIKSRSQASNKE